MPSQQMGERKIFAKGESGNLLKKGICKALHQRLKAVHIRGIGIYAIVGDVFIADHHLQVICRQKLVIAHVVLLHPHKGRIVACFGVAVPLLSANPNALTVFLQFFL